MWSYSKVIQSLTASPISGDKSHPVANLRTLKVAWVEGFQSEAFMDMLESRWRVGGGMPSKRPVRIKAIWVQNLPNAAISDSAHQGPLMAFAAGELVMDINPLGRGGGVYCGTAFDGLH